MPHLIFEYSSNIIETPIDSSFLKELHTVLASCGPFAMKDIKSRAIRHDTYCFAEGGDNFGFIHLQVNIIEGRPLEAKQNASNRLHEYLKQFFAKSFSDLKCSITVEIRDMNKDTYSKIMS